MTDQERREESIYRILLEVAVDDTGIYPASVTDGKTTTTRTEWQDGWNACSIDITQKASRLLDWFRSLPKESQGMLEEMLAADAVGLSNWRKEERDAKEEIVIQINLNDTFCFACADCEELPIQELPVAFRAWKAHEHWGLVAWAAMRRGMEPIEELLDLLDYREKYKAAFAFLGRPAPGFGEKDAKELLSLPQSEKDLLDAG